MTFFCSVFTQIKATPLNIFMLKIYQITTCDVKGVAN